jgi:prephenate dehydrogenase
MNPASRIGILGQGRFGSALAGLLAERGYSWRGWDPVVPMQGDHAATDLDALVAQSDLIIVAVPVNAFETVLRNLRPRLDARHRVMDVCSVKQGPCQLMEEVLGAEIGHVGSHPLFGPLSIARAEPLRTVLCPSPRHPATAREARALFESIGSEVTEQDPASHDRFMALTHAMAFFIARGLLDLGIGDDLRWAPPSFAALAASIAAVRADAGHLFNAIQRENPFAAPTRHRFIEALTLIDQRLADGSPEPGLPPGIGIPDLGAQSPALLEVREHIDELDRELIALLQRRCELSTRAGLAKRATGAPVLDPGREAELLAQRGRWAEQEGLPADIVQAVFRQVLTISRRVQG